MKKYLIILLAAIAALVSCGKEILDQENRDETIQTVPVTFNLTANHPDATRAVKSGWESGDAIFVFFTGAAAPKHLKMSFDGSAWISAEYNGSTQTAGALGLKNGDTGTMRAVFLPFGSDATVSADGTSFTFSTTYHAYYLTATLSYTVTDNEVSGAFNMVIPDDYVQFFIEDAAATDGGYTLGTDAVIPVGVVSVTADGSITETSDKAAGDDMTGYAYDNGTDPKGFIFSGKLVSGYRSASYNRRTSTTEYATDYYLAKTKTEDGSRADYFIQGKTLVSHSAVKLPANVNSKWQAVGSGIYYELKHIVDAGMPWEAEISLGKWYTCNYGCTVPEQLGTLYTFDDANALTGITLPTVAQFEVISTTGHTDWIWLSVHGQVGMVVKASNAFLFLPANNVSTGHGYYLSSAEDIDSSSSSLLVVREDGLYGLYLDSRSMPSAVRPFQN